MKRIICYVMDNRYIKEYQLTYEECEVREFFESLEKTTILPQKGNDDKVRLHSVLQSAYEYDRRNTLHTYEDIKEYIKDLHASSDINLIRLHVLLNSTSDMRNNEVRRLFKNYFDLYTYTETATYEKDNINEIIRKIYELGYEPPVMDNEVIRVNTEVLEDIGFSIESKIKAKQKVIK